MAKNVAHFTIDGTPICDCQFVANHDRLNAAGWPSCDGPIEHQLAAFAALAEQFPGRVALVHGSCPRVMGESTDDKR
ncbi:hypothetical protein [Rhodanobacter denitrificans]|uniref:hypothetical protein n=1 Tax=Rhodanobacter denitrificans TaxID=666685 RepID=UPI001F2A1F89|nr:hypothetical protein [Rhodanobacter denitrificans]UJJ60617.1 hypothetical protein LRK55_19475 [Rhodanobacter denitrificans]